MKRGDLTEESLLEHLNNATVTLSLSDIVDFTINQTKSYDKQVYKLKTGMADEESKGEDHSLNKILSSSSCPLRSNSWSQR